MRPWFERDPDLLERELAAFAALDIQAEVDEEARAGGLLRVNLTYTGPQGPVPLVATYPDFFPFFRPEVVAPGLQVGRHQNPTGGNLCLIGRRTSNWFAEESLAGVLATQLPHLLAFSQSGDMAQIAAVEEPQGEPASVYYNWEAVPDSYVLIDSGWVLDPAVLRGTFIVRYERRLSPDQKQYIRGIVERVFGDDGAELVSWTGPAIPQFSLSLTGRWLRLPAPILGDINAVSAQLGPQNWAWLSGDPYTDKKRHLRIGALIFPDEVTHLAHADGWGFMLFDIHKMHRGQPRKVEGYFQKSARAGATDLAARSPAAPAMENATVALFGLGAIGSHIAVELARCGVKELRLVDGDHMEPSTARRWAMGWPAFELKKARVLAERIAGDYPWTSVVPFIEQIGRPSELGVRRQGETIEEILKDVDLVVDATAEMGVNHLLSEITRLRKIPYIVANATPGAWGGLVARFYPDGPCWMCLRAAFYGDGEEKLPEPPSDNGPEGEIQPAGCAEPTFVGASFDLEEITLETVRASASMLGMAGGYDPVAWQLATLRLREEGLRTPPQWKTFQIPRRDGCPCSPNT